LGGALNLASAETVDPPPTPNVPRPAPSAELPTTLVAPLPGSDDAKAYAAARALLQSLTPEPAAPDAPEPVLDPGRVLPRASVLGITPAPSAPAARTRFNFPGDDPAGTAARSIARRVASFPNFRAQVPGAVWLEDEQARFALRSSQNCLRELTRAGIRAHPLERELVTPVATPVVLDAPVAGVAFVSLHADRDIEISCELALRLKPLARLLRKHGVRAVGINSSYRDRPKVSFHSFGLALDVMALRTERQTLIVAEHFEVDADLHTCSATPKTHEGVALLAIVCAIADSHLFSSVLTPNYNEGHRDHVHLDLRPDDPRLFLR
jgi:hypothetical protein